MPPKTYPILAPPSPIVPTEINDDHDVLCVMDMIDTLDSIPGELTQRFGDLRELDAVLNGELGEHRRGKRRKWAAGKLILFFSIHSVDLIY
jgi:hypothetical protein